MIFPELNIFAIIVAGLVPMVLGAIYYGPLFGKAWLASQNKTQEEMEPANPALTYGLALLAAMLLASSIKMTNELVHKTVNAGGELILGSHHTFGHGALLL